jgi:hypothetical protein
MIAAIEEENKVMPQEHFEGTPVIDFSITKSVHQR